MRIIIDADACPKVVKKICENTSKKYGINLVMVIDDAHELSGDYEVIKVGKGQDSVDMEIVRITLKDDIVITQDYGLATILLDKVTAVLHPNGFRYTTFNIDQLMFQRFMGQKVRNAGGRTKGPKKRKNESDVQFEKLLLEIIEGLGK